jgi:hypothetical protein
VSIFHDEKKFFAVLYLKMLFPFCVKYYQIFQQYLFIFPKFALLVGWIRENVTTYNNCCQVIANDEMVIYDIDNRWPFSTNDCLNWCKYAGIVYLEEEQGQHFIFSQDMLPTPSVWFSSSPTLLWRLAGITARGFLISGCLG